MTSPLAFAMQFAGQGRMEDHPPGLLDNARFEGRFVVWGMDGHAGPVFGDDVSLFDAQITTDAGRGPAGAHFTALRSGWALEGFTTNDGDYVGHTYGRSAADTRLRIYFDEHPDGGRTFSDRASFMRGRLVGTYSAHEYFQMDGRAGVFDTRVVYRLLESEPFTFNGVTIDLADHAPEMLELSHGHNPEALPTPEPIPHEEPQFGNKGPGQFVERFAVGGTLLTQ